LQDNGAEESGLWLADTYEGLSDVRPSYRLEATSCPIASDWRSPFVGKSIEYATNFVRNAPKPPKPLNKTWFAVMEAGDFGDGVAITLCKNLPVGGEVDLSENEQARTEQFRTSGNPLICKIKSDKQQNFVEDQAKGEGEGEGEDEGEFEVQMQSMETGDLGPWIGSDDARYWWLN
jgi:hypothetical protein